ncbi:MAG TPA: hypothetical protein VII63_11480 [Caulobacteraceae bacterium]
MKHSKVVRLVCACTAAGSAAWVGFAAAQASSASAALELPREVATAASAFSSYMAKAAGLSGRFADGAAVVQALRTGVSYEPGQFQEGMIGFGALAALRDGRFASGVEVSASAAGGRAALAERIVADPEMVLRFDGAASAARRVQSALYARGMAVFGVGGQVKQAAYVIQHQSWSTVAVADPAGRLAEVKSLSANPLAATDGDDARLLEAVLGPPLAGDADGPRPSPVVVRALALAAEAELGAASNDDLPRLRPLLADRAATDCLKMSKLNLYQCMAVAGPQYEDVFCLGQHALMDTGQCVTRAAGESGPPTVAVIAQPPAALAAADRPFIIPVAQRNLATNAN